MPTLGIILIWLRGGPWFVFLRGVAVGAGAFSVLTAGPLRAASGGAAVYGVVAALVALLRLGAIAFVGRLAGITAMGPRRVDVLVLVVIPLRHCLPPIQVPFLSARVRA